MTIIFNIMNPSVKTVDFLVIGGELPGWEQLLNWPQKAVYLYLQKTNLRKAVQNMLKAASPCLDDEDEVGIHYDDTIKAGDAFAGKMPSGYWLKKGRPHTWINIMGAEFGQEAVSSLYNGSGPLQEKGPPFRGDATGKNWAVLINKARSFPSIQDLICLTTWFDCGEWQVRRRYCSQTRYSFNIFAKAVI